MPLYQIDVEKSYGGEFWTNVYYVEAPDLGEANTLAGKIAGQEMNFHLEVISFTKARIRTVTQGDEIFVTRPIGMFGVRDLGPNFMLPLFNVVRADCAAASGRPSRKYYRGCLMNTDVTGDFNMLPILVTQYAGMMNEWFTNPLVQVPLRDVDGEDLSEFTVFPKIGMRQLRRGSKRKLEPVLGD
jgi:hypothetical protein